MISLLLLYRGGLTQPLLDDTDITELPEINLQTTVAALEATSGVADEDDAVQSDGEDSKADQWEGEDAVDDNAVQSEDEGRAGNSFQTRGRKSLNCFSNNYTFRNSCMRPHYKMGISVLLYSVYVSSLRTCNIFCRSGSGSEHFILMAIWI